MLTVLMPVASVNKFFEISVCSIKNQTYKDFVCHIICKKLDSESLKHINSVIGDDSRFMIHELELDGINFALNYGLNLVKTKYMARMDADDYSFPTRFEKQIKFLEENPKYVMVGCRVQMVDDEDKKIIQQFKFFQGNKKIRRALKYRMPLCHPAVMFRTSTLFENNGYMYGNTSEDHELYIRIARNPENLFENIPEHLFNYRRNRYQLTDMRNAWESYTDIGGFLFTEFLRTWNPFYLVGMIAVHPFCRNFRKLSRDIKGKFIDP
jgi:glycosyltransferase involved in cell wall biosynthesis